MIRAVRNVGKLGFARQHASLTAARNVVPKTKFFRNAPPRRQLSTQHSPAEAGLHRRSWWGTTKAGLAAVGRFQWKATKVLVIGGAVGIGGSYALVKAFYGFGLDNGKHSTLSSIVQVIEGQQRGSALLGRLASLYISQSLSRMYLEKWEGLEEAEIDERMKETHQRNAEKLLATIIALSGVYVKFGQEVSLMRGMIPDEYCDTFTVLQDQVPYVPFEDIEKMFVIDFGAIAEELFLEFDRVPFAAASLAQVHRAKLHDGTEVAVKVQYPAVARYLSGDLSSNRIATIVASKLNDSIKYDEDLSASMERHLRYELDFIHEATNARKCAENFKDDDRLYVPVVYDQFTSKNIMTMEFIHGCKADDLEAMKRMGVTPKEIGTIIFESLSRQMFEHGFVHADPHPGNVFVRAVEDVNGKRRAQVVLLDHGLYTEIDDKFRRQYATLWKDLINRDMDAFNKVGLDMGIRHPDLFAQVLLMQSLDSITDGMEGDLIKDHMHEKSTKSTASEGEGEKAEPSKPKGFMGVCEEDMDRWTDLMHNLPHGTHFLLRALFIQRALNQGLGAPVNRFSIMATVAAKNSFDAVLSGEDKSFSASIQRKWFGAKLVFVDYSVWVAGIFAHLFRALQGAQRVTDK